MMTVAIMMSFLFDDAKLIRNFELCKFFDKFLSFSFFIIFAIVNAGQNYSAACSSGVASPS